MDGLGFLFKSLGIDPEEIKAEMQNKIEQFESSVRLLNQQLFLISQRLSNIEKHLGCEMPPTPDEQDKIPAPKDPGELN